MTSTLYRFTTAEGLIRLLEQSSSADRTAPFNLQIDSVHGSREINGPSTAPSPMAIKRILSFDHLVCDFDETITDHDTTSSFDTLASQLRTDQNAQPEMTWSEILQAYLDDLEKVDVSDLCHLNHNAEDQLLQGKQHFQQQNGDQKESNQLQHPQPTNAHHRLLDPKVRELKCHIDGRKFTPEPELPVPKIPSLQPWIHSQVRKRAVEKVSLDRVYESGNLIGLTKQQIREYGREQVRLRPGVVKFLKAFVQEQDKREAAGQRRGEIWIISVNWSQDLIRGAMDQVFGSEEATQKYLPDANLICSNLQFSDACHEELMKRRRSAGGSGDDPHEHEQDIQKASEPMDHEPAERLSNGKVKVHCLTGTDKLHAFQKIQKDYAAKHDVAPTEVKWAYIGDSSTDLGCMVEADVGIIVGKSKSLLTECERSGVQVVDIVE
ncbi:hypothetical protein BGZ72_000117 [Mortierella alpina]|nr:hypothetical protein BGZ72_000117 [Mortierella alpina]